MKGKLLQGQSTTSLSYLGFGYTLVPGTDYSGYFTQQCDTVKVTTKPFPEVLKYYKSN